MLRAHVSLFNHFLTFLAIVQSKNRMSVSFFKVTLLLLLGLCLVFWLFCSLCSLFLWSFGILFLQTHKTFEHNTKWTTFTCGMSWKEKLHWLQRFIEISSILFKKDKIFVVLMNFSVLFQVLLCSPSKNICSGYSGSPTSEGQEGMRWQKFMKSTGSFEKSGWKLLQNEKAAT